VLSHLEQRKELIKARSLVEQACIANNVPMLCNRITIRFNNRLTRCMGRACFDYSIELSLPLWPRATKKERINTIVHEACHLIALNKYGYIAWKKPHGKLWKACMVQAGETPTRTHSVDRTGLRRKQKRYLYKCSCMTHKISGIKRAKMLKGYVYLCKHCKGKLVPA